MYYRFKKFIALGMIIAHCTFFAEILSFNYTTAIVEPFGYIPYGILYILFLNVTERLKAPSWKLYYLFGVLVGFITEAFAAKVIFFGWGMADAVKIFGVIPLESIFLTVFYHPILSFIVPLIFLKRVVGVPLKIDFGKYENPLLWLGILSPFIHGSYNADLSHISILLISSVVLLAWVILNKRYPTNNILISDRSKKIVTTIAIFFFIFTFFMLPNFNSDVVKLPPVYVTVLAVIFVVAILKRIKHKIRNVEVEVQQLFQVQGSIKKYTGFLIAWIGVFILSMYFNLLSVFMPIFTAYFIIGTIVGLRIFWLALKHE